MSASRLRAGTASAMRRRLVQGAGALAIVGARSARAVEGELPEIPALVAYLAGRVPLRGRLRLELPELADNGFVVPVRVSVAGPFAPGPYVRAIRLYSQINPVPDLATFEFPQRLERVEVDTRIRLAGTQWIGALAEMTDDRLYAAAAEVVVTLAGCMDGT